MNISAADNLRNPKCQFYRFLTLFMRFYQNGKILKEAEMKAL